MSAMASYDNAASCGGVAPKAALYLEMKAASSVGEGAANQPPVSVGSERLACSSHKLVPRSLTFLGSSPLAPKVGEIARRTCPPTGMNTASASLLATSSAGFNAASALLEKRSTSTTRPLPSLTASLKASSVTSP